MEDEKIVDLYWERSEDAVSETSQKYGRSLFKLAEGIVRNSEDARECENDTYLKAWNAIPPQKPICLYAYLAKITRRLAFGRLDYHCASKRTATIVELGDELESCIVSPSDTESQYENRVIAQAVSAFLKEQPREKRIVFIRRYWFADPISEIAIRYSMSESKVKSMLLRIRNELRIYLEKEGVQL